MKQYCVIDISVLFGIKKNPYPSYYYESSEINTEYLTLEQIGFRKSAAPALNLPYMPSQLTQASLLLN
jgi:hypothetical protein